MVKQEQYITDFKMFHSAYFPNTLSVHDNFQTMFNMPEKGEH